MIIIYFVGLAIVTVVLFLWMERNRRALADQIFGMATATQIRIFSG